MNGVILINWVNSFIIWQTIIKKKSFIFFKVQTKNNMKKTLKDIDITGKKVLMRVDFNVPFENNKISDNARIVAALESIRYVLDHGGSLILISHLGRPKGTIHPEYSLKPCSEELSSLLGQKVIMAPDSIGKVTKNLAQNLKNKEILVLENCRFHQEETESKDIESRKNYAKQLASLADIYASDAFGTAHREHASTVNIAEYLPSVAGFLMEKELAFLNNAINSPKHPFIAILGGAKISDKLPLITNLLNKANKIIIGGGMAYTFYKAMGLEIGNSLLDQSLIKTCQNLLNHHKEKIVLPIDNAVGTMDFKTKTLTSDLITVSKENIPNNQEGLDIGEKSITLFKEILLKAKTIFWNGPMGVFEHPKTAKGTFEIAKILSKATKNGAISIIGGGDSASAIRKAKLEKQMTHISTGGGASLELLEGKTLPGVACLEDR